MKKSTLIILLIGIFLVAGFAWFSVKTSREVLTAFGEMEKAIQNKNYSVKKENDSLLGAIIDKKLLTKANQVDSLTAGFTAYVESIKQQMLGLNDPKNYELMDQPNDMFFTKNGLSEKGEEFLGKINQLRKNLLVFAEDLQLKDKINNSLSTKEVYSQNGRKQNWLVYNFKGFPLVATVTRLTQIQSDVSSIESDILLGYLSE